MGWVGDWGNAVGQGSCNQAVNACASSWEPPRCRNTDQTRRKSVTEGGRHGLHSEELRRRLAGGGASCSPVSGSVQFWVNCGSLHAGPLRGRHQVLLINTVLQAVRDTT